MLALDVSVLQKEPDVLTICKPASVPVSQKMVVLFMVAGQVDYCFIYFHSILVNTD